jgi:hypothetical protein
MRKAPAVFGVISGVCLLADPGGGGSDAIAQTQADSAAPFVNVTQASNIAYRVGYTRPYLIKQEGEVSISTNGGAAAGDCDNDGDIDLFITYGNTGGPNGGGGPNRGIVRIRGHYVSAETVGAV